MNSLREKISTIVIDGQKYELVPVMKERKKVPEKGQDYCTLSEFGSERVTWEGVPDDWGLWGRGIVSPEQRFADAEIRAQELVESINRRRVERCPGGGSWIITGFNPEEEELKIRFDPSIGFTPFGKFPDEESLRKTCIDSAEELKWYFTEYTEMQEEYWAYDWSKQPGWNGNRNDE